MADIQRRCGLGVALDRHKAGRMPEIAVDVLILKLALIGVAGVGAQWLAWRFHLPAVVLMAVAGLIVGPLFGWIRPREDFGEFFQPIIGVAVAIILFEGGLNLNFAEIRGAARSVRRLVFPGVIIGWAAGAAAAHYAAGLSWPVAALLGGILVVTGPTVIMPLLRQAKLKRRPATVLKWEGILNDPLGAILAVFVFQAIELSTHGENILGAAVQVVTASIAAVILGVLMARGLAWTFRHGHVPDFLKAPVILICVLAAYSVSNSFFEKETGLLAVTAMGVALANSRVASIDEMRKFKENIAILLVSAVFVILTATLEPSALFGMGGGAIVFVLVMLFVARPLTVWLSTIGADLNWREKLLIGWIAPRGVVAAAVSGLFAVELAGVGHEEGAALVPLTFAVIFATVLAHGFSIRWLSRRLDLASAETPGVLLIGASPWSAELGRVLKTLEFPVTVADSSWRRLKPARQAELDVYYGEILSEAAEHHLELNRFGYLVAATGNEAYNALVFTDLGPEIGRAVSFQLGGAEERHPRALSYTIKARSLFGHNGWTLDDVLRRHYSGWAFQKTRLTDEYGFSAYMADKHEDARLIFIKRKSGGLSFVAGRDDIKAEPGDTVVAYAPADDRADDRPRDAQPIDVKQ